MLFISIVLSFVGTWLMNQSGSLTGDVKKLVIGLVLNFIALVIFSVIYGVVRGLFTYLGFWALVGIVITFALPFIVKEKQ